MKIHDDHEVGNTEKIIRLLCGALLGGVIGFGLCVKFGVETWVGLASIMSVSIVGCALGALFGGDSFWHRIFKR